MAAVGFPMPTKRSLRFKRFSWNKASDGSFPPIANGNANNGSRASGLKDPVESKGLVTPLFTGSTAGIQGLARSTANGSGFSLLEKGNQQMKKQDKPPSLDIAADSTDGSNKGQDGDRLVDEDEMLAGSILKGAECRTAKGPSVSAVEAKETSGTETSAAAKHAYNILPQRKPVKGYGKKKRKGAYLGPFWDDEAGSLPTSTTGNDLDFDSLLSQMVKDT